MSFSAVRGLVYYMCQQLYAWHDVWHAKNFDMAGHSNRNQKAESNAANVDSSNTQKKGGLREREWRERERENAEKERDRESERESEREREGERGERGERGETEPQRGGELIR